MTTINAYIIEYANTEISRLLRREREAIDEFAVISEQFAVISELNSKLLAALQAVAQADTLDAAQKIACTAIAVIEDDHGH
jgi:hypothetical protein